jgi:hypothetical protein
MGILVPGERLARLRHWQRDHDRQVSAIIDGFLDGDLGIDRRPSILFRLASFRKQHPAADCGQPHRERTALAGSAFLIVQQKMICSRKSCILSGRCRKFTKQSHCH